MTVSHNNTLYIGETWTFIGTIRDFNDAPINLTGAVVKLRLSDGKGNQLSLNAPSALGEITTPSLGAYRFRVSDAQQVAAGFGSGPLNYEVKAEFPDNRSSVQNSGAIYIKASLFKPGV